MLRWPARPNIFRPAGRWVQLALVLMPATVAYGLLAYYATATPMIDDFWHIFAFALEYTKSPSAAAKIGLLVNGQVGPYKLIFDHLIVVAQLRLLGHLNFPLMIVLGNASLIGLFAVLWQNTRFETFEPQDRKLLLLLPVSLFCFSINYAETLDWAISGLQQPMVILFSYAAIHFLVGRGRRSFATAVVCAVLACLTYTNGMLLWPVGLAYLLLQSRMWKRALVWCAAGASMTALYLYHYDAAGLVAQSSLASKVEFLVMFCGGGMENMHHRPVPYLSLAFGAGILVVFADSLRTQFFRRQPFFFYSTLWVLATAVVVANARIGMGLQLSLSSRYKLYCNLLFIFCYEYLLDWLKKRRRLARQQRLGFGVLLTATGFALIFCVGSDFAGAQFLKTRRMRADAAMLAYLAAPQTASPMFLVEEVLSESEVAEEQRARTEMNEASEMEIYRPAPP